MTAFQGGISYSPSLSKSTNSTPIISIPSPEPKLKGIDKLKGLNENQISLANRIKIIYWVLQQVSLKKISNKFSGQTWMICTELVLYYAQSLRLWIP